MTIFDLPPRACFRGRMEYLNEVRSCYDQFEVEASISQITSKSTMSRLNVRLCVFLFVFSIAVQFGNCQNDICDNENGKSAPGSDKTHLSWLEKMLQYLLKPVEDMGKIIDGIHKPNKNNTESNNKKSFGDILEIFADKIHVIAPGTLWCGSGDIAKESGDLGIFKKTDACCRAHDNCKNGISAGGTEVNLKNNGIFTRSACACDHAFYNCLKNASSIISAKIGMTYFNILQPQCFQCKCPTDDCNFDDGTECKNHCLKYQWINNPKY